MTIFAIKIPIDDLNLALGDERLPTLWKILTTAKLLRPSKQLKWEALFQFKR